MSLNPALIRVSRNLGRQICFRPLGPRLPCLQPPPRYPPSIDITRYHSSDSTTPETPSSSTKHHVISSPHHTFRVPSVPTSTRPSQPSYTITFTCTPCSERSTHTITKQGYHHGSVLITCPSCRNRHIISDHLGIFIDRKVTIEDLMKEKGSLVKKGTLGEDGDVEWWDGKAITETGKDGLPVVRREEIEEERLKRERREYRVMDNGIRALQQDMERRMPPSVRRRRQKEIGQRFRKGLEKMESDERAGKEPEPAWQMGMGMGLGR